jgi:transaldolase
MRECVEILDFLPMAELLWASPRELLNIIQANEVGCHIITATPDILNKLKSLDKDLIKFSLETVQMFFNDAQSAGYTINTT